MNGRVPSGVAETSQTSFSYPPLYHLDRCSKQLEATQSNNEDEPTSRTNRYVLDLQTGVVQS